MSRTRSSNKIEIKRSLVRNTLEVRQLKSRRVDSTLRRIWPVIKMMVGCLNARSAGSCALSSPLVKDAFIQILYFQPDRSMGTRHAGVRFIGFRVRAAPFFRVSPERRRSPGASSSIIRLARSAESFNKRLFEIPYCAARARSDAVLFARFHRGCGNQFV